MNKIKFDFLCQCYSNPSRGIQIRLMVFNPSRGIEISFVVFKSVSWYLNPSRDI